MLLIGAVLLELDGIFIKGGTEKGSEDCPQWTTRFRVTPDCLWQEFCQTLRRLAASWVA